MLERHPSTIETAMVPAWLTLYHSTPITWSFVEESIAALIEVMAQELTPKQQAFFLKYARAAQELITKADPEKMNAHQLKSWVDELWNQQSESSESRFAGDKSGAVVAGSTEEASEVQRLETLVDDIWQSKGAQAAAKSAAASQEESEEPFVQYARSMQRLTRQAKNAAGNQDQLRHLMKEAWLVYISA